MSACFCVGEEGRWQWGGGRGRRRKETERGVGGEGSVGKWCGNLSEDAGATSCNDSLKLECQHMSRCCAWWMWGVSEVLEAMLQAVAEIGGFMVDVGVGGYNVISGARRLGVVT